MKKTTESIIVDEDILKSVYKKACDQLAVIAESAGLSTDDLEAYFSPDHIFDKYNKLGLKCDNNSDIRFIMCRLADSLQNSGHMHNSIKFIEHFAEIQSITSNFDPEKILKQYSTDNLLWKAFYEEKIIEVEKISKEKKASIKKKLAEINTKEETNTQSEENKQERKFETNWEKYSHGIRAAAIYLVKYKEKNKEMNYQDYVNTQTSKEILLEITKAIHGMGEALASDFLKEIGRIEFGKPDVHIKAVYAELIGKTPDDISSKQAQDFLRKMAKAKDVPDDVYRIDKTLWLVCANGPHKFYIQNLPLTDKEIYLASLPKQY